MNTELTRLRFANAYRYVRLQHRARLSFLLDDEPWDNDLFNSIAEEADEANYQQAAQRVFECRQSNAAAGNVNIRLAQYKLLNLLLYANHPLDRAARNQMEIQLQMEQDSKI